MLPVIDNFIELAGAYRAMGLVRLLTKTGKPECERIHRIERLTRATRPEETGELP